MSDKQTKKTNGNIFAPFDIIAMKDVKDKNTRKPELRSLFDCIDALQSAVEDIKKFLDGGSEPEDQDMMEDFLNKITDMQVKILERTKDKIREQNAPSKVQEATLPIQKNIVEPNNMQNRQMINNIER